MTTKIYEIAQLSPTPHVKERKLLFLNYLPSSQLGIFIYDQQLIEMSYFKEDAIVTNTYPEGRESKDSKPAAYTIPCSAWVSYFGDWSIADNAFVRSVDVKEQSDDSREFKEFSGFEFDISQDIWKCSWTWKCRQIIFNSTFESIDQVKLELDLIKMRGLYTDYSYRDTSS
jgi:hypothetical protein